MGYYLDPVMWALAISLTTFAGIWTFFAYRRKGVASGLRGVALMLLPFAALFTGTLTLLLRMLDAVTVWAAGLVLSPMMWGGLVLLAVSAGLFTVARGVSARQVTRSPRPGGTAPRGRGEGRDPAPDDPEMAEIEAILRQRGIT